MICNLLLQIQWGSVNAMSSESAKTETQKACLNKN